MEKFKQVAKYIILTFFVGMSVMNLYNMVTHVDHLLEEK